VAGIRSIGEQAAIVLSLAAACLTSPVRADEPARPSNYTETIPGSNVRFEMVGIPGGTFSMGSPVGEKGRGDDEGPRHPVVIRPFWMGKLEVTWEEYDEFRKGGYVSNRTNAEALAKDADAVTRPTPVYPDETRGFGREDRPAIGMSHHAAMEYCYWLSKKTGKT
jgi:formylglycine-generating enzyme required for sulfatase activity